MPAISPANHLGLWSPLSFIVKYVGWENFTSEGIKLNVTSYHGKTNLFPALGIKGHSRQLENVNYNFVFTKLFNFLRYHKAKSVKMPAWVTFKMFFSSSVSSGSSRASYLSDSLRLGALAEERAEEEPFHHGSYAVERVIMELIQTEDTYLNSLNEVIDVSQKSYGTN